MAWLPQLPAIRYLGCRTSAGLAEPKALSSWRTHFHHDFSLGKQDSQGRPCSRFCNVGDDLYLMDRCWNARWTCAIRVESAPVLSFVVGQESDLDSSQSDDRQLQPGGFVSVLGPAAALGVAARSSFADRLRRQLSVPVVNLGRGAVGPADYLSTDPDLLDPLLAQSAAVVIVLMAGRSSANSRYPSGVDAMVRFKEVEKIAASDADLGRRLRNESLQTAATEYSTLAARVRQRAAALGLPPPKILLTWFSECALASGCRGRPSQFPQYYTDGTSVQRVAAAMGATLIDASYRRLATPYTPVPVDQCRSACPVRRAGERYVCTIDEFQRQVSTSLWSSAHAP